MKHFRTHARLYSPVAALGLAAFLQACAHWTPVALEPAKLPVTGQVRATLRTGQRVIVTAPVITNDTLRSSATDQVRWSRARTGIPLARVCKLEVQMPDATATVGLAVLGAAVIGGAAVYASSMSKALKKGWGEGNPFLGSH
jgi:hypothetical protein